MYFKKKDRNTEMINARPWGEKEKDDWGLH